MEKIKYFILIFILASPIILYAQKVESDSTSFATIFYIPLPC